jgi:hypothetical protein
MTTKTTQTRSPFGIKISRRGNAYQWQVLSRNKTTVYRTGRALVRNDAQKQAEKARVEVAAKVGNPFEFGKSKPMTSGTSVWRRPERV